MPFNSEAIPFSRPGVESVNEVAGVFGLFGPSPRPEGFECVLIVEAKNLRRRLRWQLKHPPTTGFVTHFYVELLPNYAQRTRRVAELVREFQPRGDTIREC